MATKKSPGRAMASDGKPHANTRSTESGPKKCASRHDQANTASPAKGRRTFRTVGASSLATAISSSTSGWSRP